MTREREKSLRWNLLGGTTDERLKNLFQEVLMNSVKTGTVPENGERILLFGEVPIETVDSVGRWYKGQVGVLCYGHNELGEVTLVFSPNALRNLETKTGEFFKRAGADPKKVGRKERLDVTLDLDWRGITAEVKQPPDYAYDQTTFAELWFKDRQGGKVKLTLNLDVAKQIRKKLDAFFAKKLAAQEARLA